MDDHTHDNDGYTCDWVDDSRAVRGRSRHVSRTARKKSSPQQQQQQQQQQQPVLVDHLEPHPDTSPASAMALFRMPDERKPASLYTDNSMFWQDHTVSPSSSSTSNGDHHHVWEPDKEIDVRKPPPLSVSAFDPVVVQKAQKHIPTAAATMIATTPDDVPEEDALQPQKPHVIDIAPGISARLRGAQETWSCIQNDTFLPTQCVCCALTMCCMEDAQYVLCPACRVVSPLAAGRSHGGVGLGFTVDDLQRWQADIIQQRQFGNPGRISI